MGRRAHRPDTNLRRQVETLAGNGVTEIEIGDVIGIDAKTLRKHDLVSGAVTERLLSTKTIGHRET